MNRSTAFVALLLIAIGALSGCTLASGVRLRVDTHDAEAIIRSVKTVAEKEGFLPSDIWSKTYGDSVLVEMQRSSSKRPPIVVTVLRFDGDTTLQIGRPNDRRYSKEEEDLIVRMLQELLEQGLLLKTDMVAGVRLPGDLKQRLSENSSRPNQSVESNAGLPPPSFGRSTAFARRLPGVSHA